MSIGSEGRKTLSKMTRKGQITIPAHFRQKNAMREGSYVEIREVGNKIIVEPVPDLLSQVGSDRGKYDLVKAKKMLEESRRRWR